MSNPTDSSSRHKVANIDDVARLIIDYGFLDVDFTALSQHYDIPEKLLIKASGGSLLGAITRALALVSIEFDWPKPFPTWREYLAGNALILRDFLYAHPGIARLRASGVAWGEPISPTLQLASDLRQFGFKENEIALALSTITYMTLTDRAYAETSLTSTGNLAEMYPQEILDAADVPRKGPLVSVSLRGAVARQLTSATPPSNLTPLVMDVWKACCQNSISKSRDWFISHVNLLLDGLEVYLADPQKMANITQEIITQDKEARANMTTPIDAAGRSSKPNNPFSKNIQQNPRTLDEVAGLILEHGFLDVDFDRLSRRFQIPATKLTAAARGSLSRATARAVELLAASEKWPQQYPTWQEYLLYNSIALRRTFRDNPGYARLIANGVVGDQILTYIADFCNDLHSFGLNASEISIILNETLLFTLNVCANGDAIMSSSGNIAEIQSEMASQYEPDIRTKAPAFVPDWKSIKLKTGNLGSAERTQLAQLAEKVTNTFFILDDNQSKETFLINLQLAIAGIEIMHSKLDETENSGCGPTDAPCCQ